MDKKINNNGFDYVDLELPSGTLWATCNVGADRPSDYGQYFQWGDTQGFTKEQIGKEDGKKIFSKDWSDYKWYLNGSVGENNISFKKYNTKGNKLDLEDDAAYVNMGGGWHIPTPKQIQELIENTTTNRATLDGVKGMKFSSKKDTSKFIFIPFAGVVWNGSVHLNECYGNVWTSMLDIYVAYYGECLSVGVSNLFLNGAYPFSDVRCNGFQVRGVIDKNDDNSKDKKNDMNEKLNLVEILKNVPKGTRLWSPVIGDCTFVEIDENNKIDEDKKIGEGEESYPIRCSTLNENDEWTFGSDGSFTNYDSAECVLFPSKENKDWSTFKIPNKKHKHFKPYQKVLVRSYSNGNTIWIPGFYGYYDTEEKLHWILGVGFVDNSCIVSYNNNKDKLSKLL